MKKYEALRKREQLKIWELFHNINVGALKVTIGQYWSADTHKQTNATTSII